MHDFILFASDTLLYFNSLLKCKHICVLITLAVLLDHVLCVPHTSRIPLTTGWRLWGLNATNIHFTGRRICSEMFIPRRKVVPDIVRLYFEFWHFCLNYHFSIMLHIYRKTINKLYDYIKTLLPTYYCLNHVRSPVPNEWWLNTYSDIHMVMPSVI